MAFFRLTEDDERDFVTKPEHFMGVQLARKGSEIYHVIGGQIAISARDATDGLHELPSFYLETYDEAAESFGGWKDDLHPVEGLVYLADPTVVALTINQANVNSWPFPWPAPPYGHLPHSGITTPGDVYFRFEPLPISKRLTGISIAQDTFAVPLSELPFVPTGLSAVGRYALPCFFPASYRWTISPSGGAKISFGSSVPLYGQAGGGVEIKFTGNATNTFNFTAPTVLPPL